ncbi:MAG: radical SAM protein [Patescibacteria group bacterium]|nr:B12-binding domain-containing radical SAM protein [Patescibacteria group bacterium]MBU2472897.1 B12-binding domain-containing radical SAM protein [Patescibacteria group bacterium]
MSKVLLINPAFNINKENYDSSISVGLLSIATYLDFYNIKVEIIDGVRQKNYLDLVKEKVKDCDYVGISVMTTQIPEALELSRLVKENNSDCQVIWGGPHPSFFIKQTASHFLIDMVCYGEGELTMLDIVNGKSLNDIKGIAYQSGDEVIINQPRELHDPAQMPLFNWELVPKEILENLHLIPSLTSRGCPHRCTFCINAILKNHWRTRTAEQVLEDIRIIKNKEYFSAKGETSPFQGGKAKKLRFWDENFFVDIKRAKQIINGMIEEDLITPWETTVRANYLREGIIDEEFIKKLKESGCYLLSFGAESGCPRILKKIKKDIMPEDVINSAKMCLKYGIIPQYSFMAGLPGETRSEVMETLELIDELVKLGDQVQILGPQAFRPYPGSELYKECLAVGWQEPESLDQWGETVKDELNYLDISKFPWLDNPGFIESLEAYVRFGAHSIESAMGSTIKVNKLLKLFFVLLCQLRWKMKCFWLPWDYKLAKRFVTKT